MTFSLSIPRTLDSPAPAGKAKPVSRPLNRGPRLFPAPEILPPGLSARGKKGFHGLENSAAGPFKSTGFRFARYSPLQVGAIVKAFPFKSALHLLAAAVAIVFSFLFFLYPAVTMGRLLLDPGLKTTGQSQLVPHWFESTAGRYRAWATRFLDSQAAGALEPDNVAATEWPMFGSVFFLLTADELRAQGKIDASSESIREAVDKAAEVVASPVTATWVKAKWGKAYLERENVFYRMLLILGLSSYENITGSLQYHALMSRQRLALAQEFSRARFQLLDDYPGECYPNDLLWAVAAIQRAARLDHTNHDALARSLMAAFNGPIRAPEGLPAFGVDSHSGRILQNARGCGNSGILLFAGELDPVIADQWYRAYESCFWKDTGWIAGFTEMPRGTRPDFMDVDSGPVLFGLGSVASAFGIGAAKSAGRLDHAVPLTLEAVACSWPTPFGCLLPGLLGRLAADSGCLGEVALLFSMTRPVQGLEIIPFHGRIPGIIWLLLALYAGLGLLFIGSEIRSCRRAIQRRRR